MVVISDFYEEPDTIAAALDELRIRGHDVIALHILDPLERDLDLAGAYVFEDLETGEHMPVAPAASRSEYTRLIEQHIDSLKRRCGSRQMDYSLFATDQPLDRMLFRYLSDRVQFARVR